MPVKLLSNNNIIDLRLNTQPYTTSEFFHWLIFKNVTQTR